MDVGLWRENSYVGRVRVAHASTSDDLYFLYSECTYANDDLTRTATIFILLSHLVLASMYVFSQPH